MLLPYKKSHALTAAKMIPTSNQVRVCGWRSHPPRDRRIIAASRDATASAASMYFAAMSES
jgi:hypothetical protein